MYGINQCDARYIITSQDLLKKIDRLSGSIASPLNVVYIRNKLTPNDAKLDSCIKSLLSKNYTVTSYEQVQENGYKIPPFPFEIPDPNDINLIMYTSGTTGNPVKWQL